MGLDVVSGSDGRVHCGYHRAATVRDWTLTRTGTGWSLQASIVDHTFWLSQQPLVFTIPQREGFRWPVIELQTADGTLVASLGQQESTHAVPLCQT